MKKEEWIPNCKLKCGIEVQIISKKVKCECGQDILFARTKTNRYMPIQSVGLAEFDTHFAYCPLSNFYRKKYGKNNQKNKKRLAKKK